MTTPRQDYWAAASKKANKEGNIAGVLFGLLAQPNDEEKDHLAIQDGDRIVCTHCGKQL